MSEDRKLKGKITISRRSGGAGGSSVGLAIYDPLSGIQFVDMEFSMEAWGNAVTGLGNTEGEMEVRGLQYVGLKRIWQDFIVEVPDHLLPAYSHKEELVEYARSLVREGWMLDPYLGSQKSFFQKEGKTHARMHIFKFVEPE